ncbi:MAG: SurA N-terminal domain-containing protein [Desulfobacterales bacterium]
MPMLIHHSLKIMLIVILTICFAGPVTAEQDAPETAPAADYVAKVNGEKISQQDMDRKFNLIRQRYASMGVPLDESKIDEFKENILNS